MRDNNIKIPLNATESVSTPQPFKGRGVRRTGWGKSPQ